MWRRLWSSGILKRTVTAAVGRTTPPLQAAPVWNPIEASPYGIGGTILLSNIILISKSSFSSSSSSFVGISESNSNRNSKKGDSENITCGEVKRLMRLVNVEGLKMKLGTEGKEIIPYSDLLKACESMGLARSQDEAIAFARVLDEAGVILLFRDKVYLYPDKVVELVKRAMPLALTPEDDPMRVELKNLHEKKEQIDTLAHKQVRRILWCGLGIALLHIGLFFRLTFWEFSWDVMEPISFFATTTGIIVGYAYFLMTSRDPSYQDMMKRLFLSRQRKLFKKHNFDVERFKELQKKCRTTLDVTASTRNRFGLELENSINKD